MKSKHEELGEEVDDLGGEWNKYKDSFVGIANEPCGRSTCMGGKTWNIKNGVQVK